MDKLTLILLTFCFTFAYSLPLMTGFNDDVQEGEFEEEKRATIERRTGHHKKHYLGEGFDIYGHHIGSHGHTGSMGYGYPHLNLHPHHTHHHYGPIHHEYPFQAPDVDHWMPNQWPGYLPPPFPFHLCKDEKDKDKKKEDKKKDDKKKDDKKEKEKKTKKQMIPCHFYGPPGAGWGAFQPGYTGAGWGTPYWY